MGGYTDEEQRLLTGDDVESDAPYEVSRNRRRSGPFVEHSWLFTVLIPLLLVASATTNVFQALHARGYTTRITIFPELESLKEKILLEHVEHGIMHSEFQGPPNNVTGAAWTALLQPFYFNISVDELSTADVSPSTAIQVKDGGFLASLGVYHELHCLNQLRNFLYLDSAPENLRAKGSSYWHSHLDHCIEVLRLSAMCNADLSLYTFTWPEKEKSDFLDAHSKTPRKCVDWSQVEGWSMRRKVSLTPTVVIPQD